MNDKHVSDRTAEAALTLRASTGDIAAQYALGKLLIARALPEQALPWLQKAAGAGHAAASVDLARIYLYLTQSDEDIAEAVRLLRVADARGNPAAPYLLALAALGDRALPRDFADIGAGLLRAGKRGLPQAIRALALWFGRSPHAEDRAVSQHLLQDGCGRGDPIAAVLLAERARLGEGMPADAELGERLYRQIAPLGHGRAPHVPGTVAASGTTVDRPNQLALERFLDLPPTRTLHESPWVRVCDGALGAEDCRFVAAMAQPHLRRSRVFDPEHGDAIEFEVRTSQDASLDPILEDFWLRLLQLRLARLADGELIFAEPLAVLHYGPGEQYRPHHDYLSDTAVGQHLDLYGQRRTTLCCYLNPVAAGGATAFPTLGVTVRPEPGRVVIFDNLFPDGSPDPASLHAGLPVEAGEKWLATLWLRERAMRRF